MLFPARRVLWLCFAVVGYASAACANSCSNVDVIGTFDEKSLIDYRLRRKPEQRGNFILPAAMITWCP